MEDFEEPPEKKNPVPVAVYRIVQMPPDFNSSSNPTKFHVISRKNSIAEFGDDPRPLVTLVDKKKQTNRKNRSDTSDADGSGNESSERNFPCLFCEKAFKHSSHLKRHINTHTAERIYKCDLCEKTFLDASTLSRHRKIHSGDKPWSCKVCKKSFGTLGSLRRHVTVHNQEGRPFQCETCKKRFPDNSSYQKHKFIHTGIKPHVCDICNKAFVHIGDLNGHRKIHVAVKPYNCENCGKDFAKHSNYARHLLIHEGDKDFVCQICGVSYNYQSSLTRHILTHVRRGNTTEPIEQDDEGNPDEDLQVTSTPEEEKKVPSKNKLKIPLVPVKVTRTKMKHRNKIKQLQLLQKNNPGKSLTVKKDCVTTSTDTVAEGSNTVSTVEIVRETNPDNRPVLPTVDEGNDIAVLPPQEMPSDERILPDLDDPDDHSIHPCKVERSNSQSMNESDGFHIEIVPYDSVDHKPVPCTDVHEDPTILPPMDMESLKKTTTEDVSTLMAMADDFGSTKDIPQHLYPPVPTIKVLKDEPTESSAYVIGPPNTISYMSADGNTEYVIPVGFNNAVVSSSGSVIAVIPLEDTVQNLKSTVVQLENPVHVMKSDVKEDSIKNVEVENQVVIVYPHEPLYACKNSETGFILPDDGIGKGSES